MNHQWYTKQLALAPDTKRLSQCWQMKERHVQLRHSSQT